MQANLNLQKTKTTTLMALSSFPSSFFLSNTTTNKSKSLFHYHIPTQIHNPKNNSSYYYYQSPRTPTNSLTGTTQFPSYNHHHRRISVQCRSTTATKPEIDEYEKEKKKHDLLREIQDTQRGLLTTPDRRSSIEEALICVEGYDAGTAIDLKELDGTWRLQYTSAPDVVVLFESAQRFPFLQVGQIFQKFECRDQTDGGIVRNVVRWSIPSLLEEQDGATLLVSANFSVVSKRNIYLQFEEVSVQNIKISEELQSLIAPALLPRSFLSLQILQFIQTFKAAVPVSSPSRRSVGGLYYLSYLDNNMLLGRAVGGGGVFVFTKAQPLLS